MAEKDQPETKIIYLRSKPSHGAHGHHGGAWKVAYADFVTAMMTFFLVMWLISNVSQESKQGIASYFNQSLLEMEKLYKLLCPLQPMIIHPKMNQLL
jgi:chemotaxis protein MotB